MKNMFLCLYRRILHTAALCVAVAVLLNRNCYEPHWLVVLYIHTHTRVKKKNYINKPSAYRKETVSVDRRPTPHPPKPCDGWSVGMKSSFSQFALP